MKFSNIPSPAFVLEEKLLRRNLQVIQRVQQEAGVQIILALKGFAMWSAFPIVKEYISGVSASSVYEARLSEEEMGVKAHTFSPAYSPANFSAIASHSSHIIFNSMEQFRRFYPQTKMAGHPISCGLRVNPEYSDVETDLYNPSSPNSRLGILEEHLPDELPEGVEGLHFHVLCESSAESLEKAIAAFEAKFAKHFHKLKWVNFGGGHLMTRKGYNVDHLISILKAFREKHNLHVTLEPGSAFAWQTGDLISTVVDIVPGRTVKTAILDVSFTAHMPDTLEMPYRPVVEGAKDPDADNKNLYRLGGGSCLAGDFMEAYAFDKELQIGDRIVLKDMIHYTMVKTTMFNGVHHPSIAILREKGELDVVREFGYEDYKRRLS